MDSLVLLLVFCYFFSPTGLAISHNMMKVITFSCTLRFPNTKHNKDIDDISFCTLGDRPYFIFYFLSTIIILSLLTDLFSQRRVRTGEN